MKYWLIAMGVLVVLSILVVSFIIPVLAQDNGAANPPTNGTVTCQRGSGGCGGGGGGGCGQGSGIQSSSTTTKGLASLSGDKIW